MKRFVCLLCIVLSTSSLFAATYFVSTTGSDTNPGTFSQPFKTIGKAVTVAVAGDFIYVRGGTHTYSSRINISKNGTATNRFYLWAFPGDPRPVLDFSAMAVNDANRGIQLSGNYWHIKGIDIFKAGDNGMHISGAFNIIEFCSFYENADSGLQLSNGANNNQIINCDSYFNRDPSDGNADGFAVKLDVGTGNSFKGCRAWQNSDDGWDGLLNNDFTGKPTTTYDSNWCFMNGYLKDGTASTGNGNGFKMGGGGTNSSDRKEHNVIMTRCLAAFNKVKGFDQNNNAGTMKLYNCTGYRNAPNFGMNNLNPYAPNVMEIKNCISFSNRSGSNAFASAAIFDRNSWQAPFSTSLNNSSFISIDSLGIRGPRNADGTLPHINFMKLAAGSNMIDGGVDVGLPFNGSAPDLGAFETPAAPVPAKLIAFYAQLMNNTVQLHWQVATEINNKGWDIEKVYASSNNPFVWQKIGFVSGAVNSNVVNNYQFIDEQIQQGGIYQYRLKQIDLDGSIYYSNIITIKVSAANNNISIYPNPVKSFTNIKYTVAETATVTIKLFAANGTYLQDMVQKNVAKGTYIQQINLSNYPKGNYYIRVSINNQSSIHELIKVE